MITLYYTLIILLGFSLIVDISQFMALIQTYEDSKQDEETSQKYQLEILNIIQKMLFGTALIVVILYGL